MRNNLLTSANNINYLILNMIITMIYVCNATPNMAQQSRNKSMYSPPVDSVIELSGSFGESRYDHFHSGIDIRTDGKTGWRIYAADRGYISRARISSGGFGKALYINHPGNITTVYAHLSEFFGPILEALNNEQLKKRSFEVQLFPAAGKFPVEKGQLIGYSGNTGSSGGPHLHYEHRHTSTQVPFDPGLSGINQADTVKPEFTKLVIYEPGEFGGLFGAKRKVVHLDSGIPSETILVGQRKFFIGFGAEDYGVSKENTLGIKYYSLDISGERIFEFRIDSFAFSQSRYVNALIDYGMLQEDGHRILLCLDLPGNQFPYIRGDGMMTIKPGDSLDAVINITDSNNNTNKLKFRIGYGDSIFEKCYEDDGIKVKRKKKFRYTKGNIRVNIPQNSLYEDCRLKIADEPSSSGKQDHWIIGHEHVPVHERYELIISSAEDLANGIAIVTESDTSWLKSVRRDDKIVANPRLFGKFILVKDSLAPVVTEPPALSTASSDMEIYSIPVTRISFSFADELSGIAEIDCMVNGTFMVTEHFSNSKRATILYTGEPAERYEVSIRLKDNAGNQRSYIYQAE